MDDQLVKVNMKDLWDAYIGIYRVRILTHSYFAGV